MTSSTKLNWIDESSARSDRSTASGQRGLLGLRESISTLPTGKNRRPREPDEDRLREVRVTNHQLSLVERGEFRLRGRTENLVAWRRQFVRVHATKERRRGIADNASVDLRPELLCAEQDESQVAATFRYVEQHSADVRVRSIRLRVFVQLIHKDHEMTDA